MLRIHPDLHRLLGVIEISDDIEHECVERVKIRCSAVPVKNFRRRQAQEAMIIAAREAIAGTFADHFPKRDMRVRSGWPWANCIIKGDVARIEIWIGIDHDATHDGIEAFDIDIDRGRFGLDVGERIKSIFKRAPKRADTPVERPVLELTEQQRVVEPVAAPAPAVVNRQPVAPAKADGSGKPVARPSPAPLFTPSPSTPPPRSTSMSDRIAANKKAAKK